MTSFFVDEDGNPIHPMPQKNKRGRKKAEKVIHDPVDITTLSADQIAINLRNQIYNQAMMEKPQSTILVLATKVFGLCESSIDKDDEITELTTDEILARINKLTGK